MFHNTQRNRNLRDQILTYHISSVMTDDERAELLRLPEGCRIRENAKKTIRYKAVVGVTEKVVGKVIISGDVEVSCQTQLG